MSISIYHASVPVFVRGFAQLSGLLDKAVADAEARKIEPDVLVNARLAPDMRPLSAQVQMASDTAKGAAARLAGVEVPGFADTETSFPELQERIAKTVAFLEGLPEAGFAGAEQRPITLKLRGAEVTLSGADYLLKRQVPNFFFHLTTAYAILRHNGVPIGKRDYLGF